MISLSLDCSGIYLLYQSRHNPRMELTQDHNLNNLLIRSYKPGQIRINADSFENSLIVSPERVSPNWAPQSFDALTEADLQGLLELPAELILLGTGSKHHMLGAKQRGLFLAAGIGLEVMSTHAACKTYNVLMAEGRQAIAALIIA